jgi:hypothetical protein
MLHAVALTETGRKTGGRIRPFPWAINREGQGRWFETREEALAFARQSVADGRRGNAGSASGRRPSPEGRSPATP